MQAMDVVHPFRALVKVQDLLARAIFNNLFKGPAELSSTRQVALTMKTRKI